MICFLHHTDVQPSKRHITTSGPHFLSDLKFDETSGTTFIRMMWSCPQLTELTIFGMWGLFLRSAFLEYCFVKVSCGFSYFYLISFLFSLPFFCNAEVFNACITQKWPWIRYDVSSS
jgi:hypothetical protein